MGQYILFGKIVNSVGTIESVSLSEIIDSLEWTISHHEFILANWIFFPIVFQEVFKRVDCLLVYLVACSLNIQEGGIMWILQLAEESSHHFRVYCVISNLKEFKALRLTDWENYATETITCNFIIWNVKPFKFRATGDHRIHCTLPIFILVSSEVIVFCYQLFDWVWLKGSKDLYETSGCYIVAFNLKRLDLAMLG